jgi:hypothetical protein
MSGALLLAIVTLVTVVDLAFAVVLMRSGDSQVGEAPRPGKASPEATRRVARIVLVVSGLVWLAVAALSFGLIPVDGVRPITFQSSE